MHHGDGLFHDRSHGTDAIRRQRGGRPTSATSLHDEPLPQEAPKSRRLRFTLSESFGLPADVMAMGVGVSLGAVRNAAGRFSTLQRIDHPRAPRATCPRLRPMPAHGAHHIRRGTPPGCAHNSPLDAATGRRPRHPAPRFASHTTRVAPAEDNASSRLGTPGRIPAANRRSCLQVSHSLADCRPVRPSCSDHPVDNKHEPTPTRHANASRQTMHRSDKTHGATQQ